MIPLEMVGEPEATMASADAEFLVPSWMESLDVPSLRVAFMSTHRQTLIVSCGIDDVTLMIITGERELRRLSVSGGWRARPIRAGWIVRFERGSDTRDVRASEIVVVSALVLRCASQP